METFDFTDHDLEKFREEGIDNESFDLLDDRTIEIIFPKAGPRLLFKKKYAEYKKTKMLVEVPINILPSPSYSTSQSSSVSDTFTSESIEIDWIEVPSPPLDSILEVSPSLKRKIDNTDPIPAHKKYIHMTDIFEGGIEIILQNSIDGKIVLMNKHQLNNDRRQRLVKELINFLIGKVGIDGVKTVMLDYCAEAIVKIFPNEIKETYYIPYTPKSSQNLKQAAKGKLWSRFVNVRNALKTAENINKGVTTKKSPSKGYPDKDAELEILNSIIEPRERVVELWVETYQQRRAILRTSSLTVQEIFDRYAALSTRIGPELIESDFNNKFVTYENKIYSKLPVLVNAILAEAQSRKICVVTDDDVDLTIKAILTLPYLLPPVTLKNRRKSGNWRPSRSEISESFFLHIENFEELQQKKTERLDKLRSCNLTLQPYGVICGPLNNVSKYLVVVNDVLYTFDSLIRTIEVLFKTFHALDIQYPYESQHLWQLIEEVVYEMNHSPSSSSVSALISDLKKYM